MGLTPRGAAVDGDVTFDGDDLLALPKKQRDRLRGGGMGLIFQEPMTRLDPLMKISDHFDEALKAHEPGLKKAQRRERALEALRALGIPPTRYETYPHEFSGGMRQRIMIALTLALRPKFIVADEPTTALDVLVEAQILRILADIRERFHPAILLITHNLGIVAEACDRVAVMYAGRIVEQGPVREIFGDPKHPYTQALLRSTISLSTQELHSIPGAPPDLVAPPSGCRFHPRCEHAMQHLRRPGPADDRVRPATTRSAGCCSRPTTSRAVRSPARRCPLQTKPDASASKPDSTEPLISLRDLQVHYALRTNAMSRLFGGSAGTVKAVDGVSVDLAPGEVLGLVGESGSGKSTLGRALLGLVRPSGGSITYRGQEMVGLGEHQLRPLRRKLQMVFQDPHASLNPSMTVGGAISDALRIHGLHDEEPRHRRSPTRSNGSASRRRRGSCRSTRASCRAGRSSARSSRGRSRSTPSCSSPTSRSRCSTCRCARRSSQLLTELKRDLGLTYIYITHDLASARFFCDRVAIMYLGKIVEIGPVAEIFDSPRHPYTKALLRAVPDPDPSRGVARDLPRGEVPDAARPPLGCSFHPRCSGGVRAVRLGDARPADGARAALDERRRRPVRERVGAGRPGHALRRPGVDARASRCCGRVTARPRTRSSC